MNDLKELIQRRESKLVDVEIAKNILAQINHDLSNIDYDIEAVIGESVKAARVLTAKTTGTVDVLIQGVMVKHNIPKTTKWDQEKLAALRAKIQAHNDDPDLYMKSATTYKVNEKDYKAFAPEIKAIFSEARTVVGGAPKLSFDLNWR